MKIVKFILLYLAVIVVANVVGDLYEVFSGSVRAGGYMAGSIFVAFMWYQDVKEREAKTAEALTKTLEDIKNHTNIVSPIDKTLGL